MKTKTLSQMDAIKSIRKPIAPAVKVERPEKGGGYKRNKKHKKSYEED
jgi:hypothetical protein